MNNMLNMCTVTNMLISNVQNIKHYRIRLLVIREILLQVSHSGRPNRPCSISVAMSTYFTSLLLNDILISLIELFFIFTHINFHEEKYL